MGIPTIIRRSFSKAAPLATRLLGSQRNAHSAATTTAFSVLTRPTLSPRRIILPDGYPSGPRFCSTTAASDDGDDSHKKLVEFFQSEIEDAEERKVTGKSTVAVPTDFPFTIEDYPREDTVTLTREYNGETITMVVGMPDSVTDEEDDGKEDDDNESCTNSRVALSVTVSKTDDDNGSYLEFKCTAFPDEIRIDKLFLKFPHRRNEAYEGPHFFLLGEDVKKAFYKYLEIRGVKPSIAHILHELMAGKENKEYLTWLKEVKSFVEEKEDDVEEAAA